MATIPMRLAPLLLAAIGLWSCAPRSTDTATPTSGDTNTSALVESSTGSVPPGKVMSSPPARPVVGETIVAEQDVPGREGRVTHIRIVHQASGKYPLLRHEEHWRGQPGKSVREWSSTMAADHLQVTRPATMTDAAFRHQVAIAGGSISRVSHDGQRYLVGFDGTKPDTMPHLRQALQAAQMPICEPDYVVNASDTVPNDPSYAQMWALHNTGQTGGVAGADIHAQQAWSVATGSTSVVVAVIDTGMDLTHPDLIGNLWTNAAEVAGNGRDDDSDGFIDDVHGWNFVADSADPTDDYFHGTHCSGIIGATGNNGTGVVGVCWHVTLMPLKFLDANGSGFTSDAVEAIHFATSHHVQVMSMSWGGLDDSATLKAAIDDAGTHGILCVAAAGNSSNDTDISPEYPAAFSSTNLISVLATDSTDQRAFFSNAGAGSVDVGAPGVDVLSTLPMIATAQMRAEGLSAGYGLLSGTSMATPHVAGACALLWSHEPTLTAAQVKLRILQSANRLSSLAGLCVSEGRLDLDRLLRNTTSGWVFAGITAPIGDWFEYHRPVATDFPLTGTANASGFTTFTVEVGSGATPTTWTTTGITRAGGGLQAVSEGALAQCHVSASSEGFWTVRLTVNGSSGSRSVTRTLWVDPALKPGFPTLAPQVAGSDSQIFVGVTLADLTGSGHPDLIGSAQTAGPLYAVGPDGANLPGWPLSTVGVAYPSVGDVDGDGYPDIAFGTFATSGPPWGVVDRTGAFLPGWPQANANYTDVSMAMGDLDGDGRCEIVTTNNNLYVSVLRGNGTSLPGWPQMLISGQAATGLSVVDLDGDGIPEIVAMDAGSTSGVYIDAWHVDGSPAPGFPHLYQSANSGTSRFALGDIDHDGKVDIVFNGGSRGFLYAINGDGSVKPGWPVAITDGGTFPEPSAPVLADLFGDGKLETIIAYTDLSNVHVMVWRPDGSAVPGWPVIIPGGGPFLHGFSPAVGDIDGDGKPDIVMGTEITDGVTSILATYDASGHMLAGWPKTEQLGGGSSFAISDIDGDGRNELVVLSSMWSGHNILAPLLYAWDFNAPGTHSGRVEWGQMGASASHRHLYRASGDVPTLSNQTLTVATGKPLPIALGGHVPTGFARFYRITNPPAHGTLSGSGANRTYTSASGFSGTDSIGVILSDGERSTMAATIAITVTGANQAPVISATTASPALVVLPATAACSVSASDGDGPSPLISTWTVQQGPGPVVFAPNGTTSAAHTTATFATRGTYILQVAVNDGLTSTLATTSVQVVASGQGHGVTGRYYPNMTLAGVPVSRLDGPIDFNWGGAAPVAGIGADHFSVRWVGEVVPLTTESYTFVTESDDGVRLWIDGHIVINNWTNHSPTINRGIALPMVAGTRHELRMEYFENTGGAVARLRWSSPLLAEQPIPASQLFDTVKGTGTGLAATYFPTMTLSGTAVARQDPKIDFDWGTGAPITGIGSDHFSARWVGQIAAPSTDSYTFSTLSDDGVRVWLDGDLLIDRWTSHSPTTDTAAPVHLLAGDRHDLRVEYFENTGGATVRLRWATATSAAAAVPTLQLYPQPPPSTGSGTGLTGAYYATADLSGPAITRTDPVVDFDWGTGSPLAGMPADHFTARWTGEFEAISTEACTFTISATTGVRLWIEGTLVIDQWTPQQASPFNSQVIALTAGQHYDIRLEYRNDTGPAAVHLLWSTPTRALAVIPATQLYPTLVGVGRLERQLP